MWKDPLCFLARSLRVTGPKVSSICQEGMRTTIEVVFNNGTPDTPENELLHKDLRGRVLIFDIILVVASSCCNSNVGGHCRLKVKCSTLPSLDALQLYSAGIEASPSSEDVPVHDHVVEDEV